MSQEPLIQANKCQDFLDYIANKRQGKKLTFLPVSLWEIPDINPIIASIVKDEDPALRKEVFIKGAYRDKPKRYSEFKPDVALRCLEYYGFEGCITIDPFMGRATRGTIAALLNQNYIGYDVSPAVVEWANAGAFTIVNEFLGKQRAKAIEGDGCLLTGTDSKSVDLVFTCPPYWNLEPYDGAPSDLSYCGTYEEFLGRIRVCAENCYRVLKLQGFCVFVVGDWKSKGAFYHFSVDLINIFEQAGFFTHDIGINKVYSWLSTQLTRGQNIRYRYLGKIHEYIIVFRKQEKAFRVENA